jgi:hypothetical protein
MEHTMAIHLPGAPSLLIGIALHRATYVATWLLTHRRTVAEWLPAYAADLEL